MESLTDHIEMDLELTAEPSPKSRGKSRWRLEPAVVVGLLIVVVASLAGLGLVLVDNDEEHPMSVRAIRPPASPGPAGDDAVAVLEAATAETTPTLAPTVPSTQPMPVKAAIKPPASKRPTLTAQTSCASARAPSVDGRALWVATPAGAPRRLTSSIVEHFRWAPDGSAIAYLAYEVPEGRPGPGRDDELKLRVIALDGSGPKAPLGERHAGIPEWSHDSRLLVYPDLVDGVSGIYSVPAEGGTPTKIYESGGPIGGLSVDRASGRMAFVTGPSLERAVWVVDADGNNARKLTPTSGHETRFSPDGKHIAFFSEGRMAIVELATGAVSRFSSAQGPSAILGWSPDSRWAAFYRVDEQGRTTSVAVGSDGSGERAFGPIFFPEIGFSPDGRQAVVVSPNPDLAGTAEVVDLDGSSRRPVVANATDAAWSPAGGSIVATTITGPQTQSMCVVDAGSGQTVATMPFSSSTRPYKAPRWSPDGSHFAFSTLA